VKSVLFIAGIGINDRDVYGGMLAKNRFFYDYLKNKEINLKVIDTYVSEKKILNRILSKLIINLKRIYILLLSFFYDEIIISDHAYKIISILNKLNQSYKITFFVVGGAFNQKLSQGILDKKKYYDIKHIYVETYKMKKDLLNLGLKNVERVPNFKTFNQKNKKYKKEINEPIKLFYIGRIHSKKGINLAVKALRKINKEKQKFILDFYGPINKEFNSHFLKEIKKNDYLNYCGCVDLVGEHKEYHKLSDYDLFIFPTFWPGEGFPGVIIDSFILGIPVLASDWHYNSEIVKDKYNGILFEPKKIDDLCNKLNYIYKNKEILIRMSKNSYKSAKKYKTEKVLEILGLD